MTRTTHPLPHNEVQKAKKIDKYLTLHDGCIYTTYQVMG